MSVLSRRRFGALAALSCGLMVMGTAAANAPVAIVYSLAGEASLAAPHAARRPLRLFDRLGAGTTVQVGPGARLALAFVTGRRYELGERSRVTLGAKDLATRSGPVRALPRVPPLPRISPIAAKDRPGAKAGAVRIRAESLTDLYPDRGATALAEKTVLRFQPVAATRGYRIEVQDDRGRSVFATETADSTVRLPAGILQPGRRYRWWVSTVERAGPVARGEAELVTLPQRTAEAREALRQAVEAAADGSLLALLAEVDRSLGLLAEAREEFRAALQESPGDTTLAETLGRRPDPP